MEEAWPVGTWVLRLFDSIMARLKAPVRTSSANIPKQRTQNCEPQSREPKEPFTKDATTAVDSALEASDLAPDQPVMADAENPQDISHEHDIDQSVFDNRSFVNDGQWDQPYTEMDARVLSSVFAFEESMDRVSADQGIFLQWLDDGLLQGTDLNSWSW